MDYWIVTLKVYGDAGRAVPTSNLQSMVPLNRTSVLMQSVPYVVEAKTSVTLNFVFMGALAVAFTCTWYTRCPATIVVFAVLGKMPNVTGLVQEVPADDPAVGDDAKPLSVARRPFATITTEPISAR